MLSVYCHSLVYMSSHRGHVSCPCSHNMSQPNGPASSLVYTRIPSYDGQRMDESKRVDQVDEISDTTSRRTSKRMKLHHRGGTISSTQGCRQEDKNNISIHRSNHLLSNTVKTVSSSQTSQVDSISRELGSTRYWQECLKERYKQCIVPTKTDCVASHTISLKRFSETIIRKSKWQTVMIRQPPKANLPKTCFPLSQFLVPNCMDLEAERERRREKNRERVRMKKQVERELKGEKEKGPPPMTRLVPLQGELRSYKLKLWFPDPTSKNGRTRNMPKWLREWFDAARDTYNRTLCHLRSGGRANLTDAKKIIIPNGKDWTKKTPSRVHGRVVGTACSIFNTAANAQRKRIWIVENKLKPEKREKELEKARAPDAYRVSYNSLKSSKTQFITIEKTQNRGPISHIKQMQDGTLGLCLTGQKTPCMMFRDSKRIHDVLLSHGKLQEDALVQWDKVRSEVFLIVRLDVPISGDDRCETEKSVVGLDPGLRSFNTFYSPDGTHGELGVDNLEYINAKLERIRVMKAKIGQGDVRKRQRQHYKRAIKKIYHKLRNWRRNMHYTCINFLYERWDTVICPRFNPKSCMEDDTLTARQKKQLQQLGHYEFRQRLLSRANRYPGRNAVLTNEPGTTRTCCVCGHWNADLGAAKEWVCPTCETHHERDITGAVGNVISQIGNFEYIQGSFVMQNRWKMPDFSKTKNTGCVPRKSDEVTIPKGIGSQAHADECHAHSSGS